MKTKLLLLAAFAATSILSSCSNEEPSDANLLPEGKAKLTISAAAPNSSRAEGLSTDNSDNAINNFVAFVFKANGSMEEKLISPTGVAVQSLFVTTAAREVYVVGNAPAALFAAVNNKDALFAVLGNLALSDNVAAQTSTSGGNVWASGMVALTSDSFILDTDTHVYKATVPVVLTFVSAKINVTIDNQMINKTAENALAITNVAILNAVTNTKFYGTSLIPSPVSYYSGIGETGFHVAPAGYSVQSFLTNNYTEGTESYHYYVFENNSDAYPVILTLVATYGNETRYFPVHFKISDIGHRIVRGNSYEVKIKLTGDADPNSGSEPGTDDPTDPYVRANMTVSVTVNTWITNPVINKEF